jgi:hypothetical protein
MESRAARGAIRSWLRDVACSIPLPPGVPFSSRDYWERRYLSGGDSGAGSEGRFAAFKAEIVNAFVRERGVASVIELGCGDGSQVRLLDCPSYVGLDVSPTAVALCRARCASDDRKRFEVYEPSRFAEDASRWRAEAALSLDVLYHLVEDRVYDQYLAHLFGAATRFVIVYSCDHSRVRRLLAPHVRGRCYSRDVRRRFPAWQLLSRVPNPYPYVAATRSGSWSDFAFYGRSD